jgi:hypothetical protein
MSRNWQSLENPPRHFRPTASHLRDVARRGDYSLPPGSVYVPLPDLSWPAVVTLAEGIERFIKLHPSSKRGI